MEKFGRRVRKEVNARACDCARAVVCFGVRVATGSLYLPARGPSTPHSTYYLLASREGVYAVATSTVGYGGETAPR